PAPAPPAPQAAPAGSSKVFNPDISVIGNFLAVTGKNPGNAAPSLSLTEAEVAFQAVIDAYATANFYIGVSPEGAELEEGYATFTALPGNLLLKVGKMRAQFGKVNTLHTHAVPYTDRPLVTENLVGGEEGVSDSGLSLSHLIQMPAIFLEATAEVYQGNSAVFQTSERSRLNYGGRLRAYRDLTEASNLDVGASITRGPTDVGTDLDKRLVGVDVTFRYRPLRRAIYRRLNLRTELIWSRQELPGALHASAFGFYGLGEYQFARRWYVGARVDRSGRTLEADATDTGGSFFLTFWPTEFSLIRGQFRHIKYAEGHRGNEVLFQLSFSIGAHGAHVF
ncbi:MAG: hypothetical protein NUW22_14675, partial [Acidobacteria bacterium]|nr:hypothetical protein [Acidobacteriota bacterium]